MRWWHGLRVVEKARGSARRIGVITGIVEGQYLVKWFDAPRQPPEQVHPNRLAVAERIEMFDNQPDEQGRRRYARHWLADYHPGDPNGEHRRDWRAQHYFRIPSIHCIKLLQLQADSQRS